MAAGLDFSGMVPGLDFLQNLMKGAGAALPGVPGLAGLPGIGQWVAPTLDPAELEKRISELRTVQFWLEQNAKLLGATIQALEVQRMTLATLQTMNLPMADLRDALSIKPPPPAPPPPAPAPAPAPAPEPAPEPSAAATAAPPPAPPAIDPMQWWGALTQQFTEIANQALQATAAQEAATAPAQSGRPAAAPAQKPARRAAASPPVRAASKLAKAAPAAKAPPARSPAAAPRSKARKG